MEGHREAMETDEKRILVVEDETVIRDAVSAYLERENYTVRGVGDGQSAVEEFEKFDASQIIRRESLQGNQRRFQCPNYHADGKRRG